MQNTKYRLVHLQLIARGCEDVSELINHLSVELLFQRSDGFSLKMQKFGSGAGSSMEFISKQILFLPHSAGV